MKGLSYRERRRWALVILVMFLPIYIAAALWLVSQMDRPRMIFELAIYIGLGIAWALPFRFVFRGIGKEDPEQQKDRAKDQI